jgi:hypothetical protein
MVVEMMVVNRSRGAIASDHAEKKGGNNSKDMISIDEVSLPWGEVVLMSSSRL